MVRIVVGITGASGVSLAVRLIQVLGTFGHTIELVMSQSALYTAKLEMGDGYSTTKKFVSTFSPTVQENLKLHQVHDVGCAIASGSYPVDAMVIIPCSMTSLAAIAMGLGDNALRRAADVALKEKRPLILVPRESPLSTLHLENLLKLSTLGATIIPPVPAWYTQPKSIEDIENFIVGKVLDALRIDHTLYPRWGV